MTSLSSPESSNPGMAASTRQLPYAGGFGGRNRKVELPNIQGLRKKMSRAVARELAAFQRMPISCIAKSIGLALGKKQEKPEAITCTSYQAQTKEPEVETDICDAFSRGRSPERKYQADLLEMRNVVATGYIGYGKLRPELPIEVAMQLSAVSEGLAPPEFYEQSMFLGSTAFKMSYSNLALHMLESSEFAAAIEMEFRSHGAELPPNLVRVIEHLRNEQMASRMDDLSKTMPEKESEDSGHGQCSESGDGFVYFSPKGVMFRERFEDLVARSDQGIAKD